MSRRDRTQDGACLRAVRPRSRCCQSGPPRTAILARRGWPSFAVWPLVCLLATGPLPGSRAQGQSLEYAIKATYLHKFAPFVDWPNPTTEFPDGAFTLCSVGDDPVGGLLDRVTAGEQVNNHPIVIRRLSSVSGDPRCSVMYLTGPPAQVAANLQAVRGMPVLTVTDGATDPAATGIINFVIEDGRVRFAIDNSTAEADGLIISSKLLSLAVHVTGSNR